MKWCRLLLAGKDVCVDKPLAETLQQAERWWRWRKAQTQTDGGLQPALCTALPAAESAQLPGASSLRIEKHRADSVGTHAFTLLDDYLHVVDTALWLAGGKLRLELGHIDTMMTAQCSTVSTISRPDRCKLPPVCIAARAA